MCTTSGFRCCLTWILGESNSIVLSPQLLIIAILYIFVIIRCPHLSPSRSPIFPLTCIISFLSNYSALMFSCHMYSIPLSYFSSHFYISFPPVWAPCSMRDHVSENKVESNCRKTPNDNLWSPYAHIHINTYVNLYTDCVSPLMHMNDQASP